MFNLFISIYRTATKAQNPGSSIGDVTTSNPRNTALHRNARNNIKGKGSGKGKGTA